jgi:hypothetical protein
MTENTAIKMKYSLTCMEKMNHNLTIEKKYSSRNFYFKEKLKIQFQQLRKKKHNLRESVKFEFVGKLADVFFIMK